MFFHQQTSDKLQNQKDVFAVDVIQRKVETKIFRLTAVCLKIHRHTLSPLVSVRSNAPEKIQKTKIIESDS